MSNWVSVLRRMGRAVTISCVALAASLAAAHAQSFTITNITKNTATKASFPTMVTDSKGNLNVAWIDSANGIMFARSTDGKNFSAPIAVQKQGGNPTPVVPSFQPQIAVDKNDTTHIEITWAAPDSTPAAPVYDVFAARSNDSGGHFALSTKISGPVALFDSPRLAFDGTGKVNIVWGRTGISISQAQDGVNFGAPIPLNTQAVDSGGPRIAVTSAGHIFVAWTDEANKSGATSFCTHETADATGAFTNTNGGNFWINETVDPSVSTNITAAHTRNLSATDWNLGANSPNPRFHVGFYGCSYDNLDLYLDHIGQLHFLWSDDTPDEDILTSLTFATYPAGSPFAGLTEFSFPINLANVPAASPQVAVDGSGSFYTVWSGSATVGTSQGIFFSRADAATPITDTGKSFTPPINIAPQGAVAPAFPQIAVDSSSNVNIVWEQATGALKRDGTDMFNVFFARSTDRGNTFPTVLQVTTAPSTLCYEAPPPPEGTTPPTPPTTPDVSTCGTVQLGVDTNSIPDMAWVNQASGSAVADIDFATTAFPTGSLSSNAVSLLPTTTTAAVTITVSQNGFSGPVTFSCFDVDTNSSTLPSWLTCTFNPPSLNPAQSTTDTLTFTRAGTPTTSMLISGPSSHVLPGDGRPMAWSMALATFCLISMTMLAVGRRKELSAAVVMRGFLVMALTLALAAGMVSCGGSTSSPSTTSTTSTTGTSGSGGGSGGSGGGTTVTVHVAVMAQAGSASAMNLGTVAVTAQ